MNDKHSPKANSAADFASENKTPLLAAVRQLLSQSRRQLQQTINSTMVQTYWQVGQLIVEDGQQGEACA